MRFLSAIATDFKRVFAWVGSPKGQAVITGVEGVILSVDPALSGIFSLANSWMNKVLTTESLAAAAGQQNGSGTQKASAVLVAMGPEISKYFPTATAAEISNANNAIVAFLQAFNTVPTLVPTPALPCS